MNNILITGSNGQLGSEIKQLTPFYSHYNFLFTDVSDLDITDHAAVDGYIQNNNIDIIINCAAYTAVDKAESEPEMSDAINHLAVAHFAQIAKEKNIKLIHISTDYVFEGTNFKPYIETDIPNPQSVYGKTKLNGELALQLINPANSIILRTSWVYSSFGNNFIKTMLNLAKKRSELNVIFDQIGTPTYAKDLASTILEILPRINNENVELYHYSNEGVCSWYDFSKLIFELSDAKILINPIRASQFPTSANRPFYSILDKSKIKERFKIDIPFWKDSVKQCLTQINPDY